MADRACLDAGVVIKLFVPEDGQDRAWALLERIRDERTEIVAPAFLGAEVLSSLRRKVTLKTISREEGDEAAASFLSLLSSIRQLSEPAVYERAWTLADQLEMNTIYDAVYLAVAEALNAQFWTADRKLYDRVQTWGWGRMATRLL